MGNVESKTRSPGPNVRKTFKDRNLFHRVNTIGNIFMSGAATSENITDGVHEMK